jgi:hypothetical protein
MRRKTIVEGFRNGQRIRYLVGEAGRKFQAGAYCTITQMSEDICVRDVRVAVWDCLIKLGRDRRIAVREHQPLPTGIVVRFQDLDVQVDLVA